MRRIREVTGRAVGAEAWLTERERDERKPKTHLVCITPS